MSWHLDDGPWWEREMKEDSAENQVNVNMMPTYRVTEIRLRIQSTLTAFRRKGEGVRHGGLPHAMVCRAPVFGGRGIHGVARYVYIIYINEQGMTISYKLQQRRITWDITRRMVRGYGMNTIRTSLEGAPV